MYLYWLGACKCMKCLCEEPIGFGVQTCEMSLPIHVFFLNFLQSLSAFRYSTYVYHLALWNNISVFTIMGLPTGGDIVYIHQLHMYADTVCQLTSDKAA